MVTIFLSITSKQENKSQVYILLNNALRWSEKKKKRSDIQNFGLNIFED